MLSALSNDSYCCQIPGAHCLIWGLCERCPACTGDPPLPAAAAAWEMPASGSAHTPPGTGASCMGNYSRHINHDFTDLKMTTSSIQQKMSLKACFLFVCVMYIYYFLQGAFTIPHFFMTRNSVRLLPKPSGLSRAGRTSGYSSWAPGSSGTSAVKARYTVITLGWAVSFLGTVPKWL